VLLFRKACSIWLPWARRLMWCRCSVKTGPGCLRTGAAEALARIGLQALAEAADLQPGQIDSYALTFILAPPLNAAGRLGEADRRYACFWSRMKPGPKGLALALHRTNRQRRDTGDADP